MRNDWVTQLANTGAEAFVATALTADFDWLRQRLEDVLGPLYPQHLVRSRERLDGAATAARSNGHSGDPRSSEAETRSDEIHSEEIQQWGERLGAALRDRPELAIRLRSVVDEAGVRLLLAPPRPAVRSLGLR
jgi:hypothetical protein